MVNPFGFLHIINSSLWITVLVVRVGCIIEARASQVDIDTNLNIAKVLTPLTEGTASLLVENPMKKKPSYRRYFSNRSIYPQQLSKTTMTTTLTTMLATSELLVEDDDSCSGKTDGYYPNFGSACTSYYFCAAGYQITYVCPPAKKFNGKKCDEDYICPTAGHLNLCQGLPNGYYPNPRNSEKYFYCYQRAKVIELSCDKGKVFIGDECLTKTQLVENTSYRKSLLDTSCVEKSNGFYPDLQSKCLKYYYCIGGMKTDLECQNDFLFNGDICVYSSMYLCPRVEDIEHSSNKNTNLRVKDSSNNNNSSINISNKNYRKTKVSTSDTEESLSISNLVTRDNEAESTTTTNYG